MSHRQPRRAVRPNRVKRQAVLSVLVLELALAGVGFGPPAVSPPAEAATVNPYPAGSSLSITFVGVVCDDYEDVQANKARNNVQESLQDLGPDSTYRSGSAITPAAETAGMNSAHCRPLPGLQFTLGSGMVSKSQATYYLSYVSGATATVTTQASVPQLNSQGRPAGPDLDGAVTVVLDREVSLAQRGNLWVQGGTPSNPRPVDTTGQYQELSFAALRCAYDAVNGDNVEKVAFNSGSRHVYCYYYAIGKKVEAGTIVVQKVLAPDTIGQGVFRFDGNLSYADSNGDDVGDFSLTATRPGQIVSQSFVRAVGASWDFREYLPPTADWMTPASPVCVTTGGGSAIIANHSLDTGRTSGRDPTRVTLTQDGQTVTCTYTNTRLAPTPTPGYPFRRVWKEAIGGDGVFDFLVTFPGDPAPLAADDVPALDDGTSTLVREQVGTPQAAKAGRISVVETMPTGVETGGSWTLSQGSCAVTNGPNPDPASAQSVPMAVTRDPSTGAFTATLSRDLTATENADCLITNTFTPTGHLRIRKQISPDSPVPSDAFSPNPAGDPEAKFSFVVLQELVLPAANAILASYGASAALTPAEAAAGDYKQAARDPSSTLAWPATFAVSNATPDAPRYQYVIQESTPPPNTNGTWQTESIRCVDSQGRTTSTVPGSLTATSVAVELTADEPDVECTFVNVWVPSPILTIVKQATADTALRPSGAELSFQCRYVDAGEETIFGQTVWVGPGVEQESIKFQSGLPLTCVLFEAATDSGAAAGVEWSVDVSAVNHGQPVTWPTALGTPFSVSGGDDVTITVVNSYTPPPPAVVTVRKQTVDDIGIRPNAAQLDLTCQPVGAAAGPSRTLTVPPGVATAQGTYELTSLPYSQPQFDCVIAEPDFGLAPDGSYGAAASLSLTLDGGSWPTDPAPQWGEHFTVERGHTVEAAVVNTFTPQPRRTVSKQVVGGAGAFDFTVAFPGQPAQTVTQTAVGPAGATEAVATLTGVPAVADGAITLTETVPSPATAGGVWALTSATCTVAPIAGGPSRTITLAVSQDAAQPQVWQADSGAQSLAAAEQADCQLVNTFTPAGRINLSKTGVIDIGNLADHRIDEAFPNDAAVFGYTIAQYAQDLTDPSATLQPTGQTWSAVARLGSANRTAVPALPGADTPWPAGFPVTDGVTRYQYVITETTPPDSMPGRWRPTALACSSGQVVALSVGDGSLTVEPTAASPLVDCQFTNTWQPGPVVEVVKNATGQTDLRDGPATLRISCHDPDAVGWTPYEQDLTVAPGATSASTGRLLAAADIICEVTETADGAALDILTGAVVSATNHGQPVTGWTPALDEPFEVARGDDIVFTVDNTYTAPPAARLLVVKQTVADTAIRGDEAQLSVDCQPAVADRPAVTGAVAVPAGQTTASGAFQAYYPMDCVVTETGSGVPDTYDVLIQATLAGQQDGVAVNTVLTVDQPTLTVAPFTVRPGDDVTVSVVNTVHGHRDSTTPWRLWKQAEGADGVFPAGGLAMTISKGGDKLDKASSEAVTVSDGSVVPVVQINPAEWTWNTDDRFDVAITETLPTAAGGSWAMARAYCLVSSGADPVVQVELTGPVADNGAVRYTGTSAFAFGDDVDCYAVNTFTPVGRLQIAKTTLVDSSISPDDAYPGGSADFAYTVTQLSGPDSGQLTATGRTYGAAATVTPAAHDSVDAAATSAGLTWTPGQTPLPVTVAAGPVYRYQIAETAPAATAAGEWRLDGVACGDAAVTAVDLANGTAVVELTEAAPEAECVFTNRWAPAAIITVTKTATSDTSLRPEAAKLDLTCTPSPAGTPFAQTIVVAPGSRSASLSFQVGFPELQCTVTETATGAAAGEVTTSAAATWQLDGGTPEPLGGGTPFTASFTVESGQRVDVVVANDYQPLPAQVTVTKAVPGPAGPETAVQVAVFCRNKDSQTVADQTIVWDPATLSPGGVASLPLTFDEPVDCVVTEPADGSGAAYVLDGPPAVVGDQTPAADPPLSFALGSVFSTRRGQTTAVTVTDAYVPTPTRQVFKQTVGGTGQFAVEADFPGSPIASQTTVAITPGAVVLVGRAAGQPVSGSGPITITETVPDPAAAGGQWALTAAVCQVTPVVGGAGRTITLTPQAGAGNTWTAAAADELQADENADCTLTNTFTPAGRIRLVKTVDDSQYDPSDALPAQFGYTVTQRSGPAGSAAADLTPTGRVYDATAAIADASHLADVEATPGVIWPADGFFVTDAATIYEYTIAETLPPATPGGRWLVQSASCQVGGTTVDGVNGVVTVRPTAADPVVECQFANVWLPAARLTVVKNTTSDVERRDGPAVVTLTCQRHDGGVPTPLTQTIVVQPGTPSASLTLTSDVNLADCRLTEDAAGNADGVIWTHRFAWSNRGQVDSTLDLGDLFDVVQGDDVRVVIDNLYTPPPPAWAMVVKRTTDDETIRPETATLSVDCVGDDGATIVNGLVQVGPGDNYGAELFAATRPMTCTVVEPAAGQAESEQPGATVILIGHPQAAPWTLGEPFRVEPGDQLTLEVTNTFSELPRRHIAKQAVGGAGEFDFTVAFPGAEPATTTGLSVAAGATA
ncbi:MAG: DUF5979 domain-containing protein, partial [Propionibacteriaceae bacterium]|nr:DUF5979 domain-containing protein [Propionibacteriaceae bacterium]